VLRHDDAGQPITDADPLLCASGFGDPNRISGPSIGVFVNAPVDGSLEIGISAGPESISASSALAGSSAPAART
jgi:hypothetical protein